MKIKYLLMCFFMHSLKHDIHCNIGISYEKKFTIQQFIQAIKEQTTVAGIDAFMRNNLQEFSRGFCSQTQEALAQFASDFKYKTEGTGIVAQIGRSIDARIKELRSDFIEGINKKGSIQSVLNFYKNKIGGFSVNGFILFKKNFIEAAENRIKELRDDFVKRIELKKTVQSVLSFYKKEIGKFSVNGVIYFEEEFKKAKEARIADLTKSNEGFLNEFWNAMTGISGHARGGYGFSKTFLAVAAISLIAAPVNAASATPCSADSHCLSGGVCFGNITDNSKLSCPKDVNGNTIRCGSCFTQMTGGPCSKHADCSTVLCSIVRALLENAGSDYKPGGNSYDPNPKGICLNPLDGKVPCTTWCGSPYFECNATSTEKMCVPNEGMGVGKPCSSNSDCDSSLFCSYVTKECTPGIPGAKGCGSNADCQASSFSGDLKCVEDAIPGVSVCLLGAPYNKCNRANATTGDSDTCLTGLACGRDNICHPLWLVNLYN